MEAAQPIAPREKRTRPRTRRRLSDQFSRGLLGANAALVFGFLYLPVLILIVFSFNDTRSVAVFTGFSTQWYSTLIANEELLDAARNSLLVGLVAMVASTVIGTMTALGMDRFRFRFQTAFDANLYMPIVIPEIVMGISLLLFYNQALFPLLEAATGYRGSTGLPTIAISHIAFNIPFVYVIVRARLADFDRALEEAAQDLGANEWRTFRRITLPLLMPGIIGGALLAFTLSLDDYLITVFTKGVREQTMPLYIYSLVRRGVTPEINALSTVLLSGSIGLVALSLTAQGGGILYTRAMSVGALIGSGLYGLTDLLLRASGGTITGAAVALDLVLIGLLVFLFKSLQSYREELGDSNTAGRILSLATILIVAAAALFSLVLLF